MWNSHGQHCLLGQDAPISTRCENRIIKCSYGIDIYGHELIGPSDWNPRMFIHSRLLVNCTCHAHETQIIDIWHIIVVTSQFQQPWLVVQNAKIRGNKNFLLFIGVVFACCLLVLVHVSVYHMILLTSPTVDKSYLPKLSWLILHILKCNQSKLLLPWSSIWLGLAIHLSLASRWALSSKIQPGFKGMKLTSP